MLFNRKNYAAFLFSCILMLLLAPIIQRAHAQPKEVMRVLGKAGANAAELEKSINYFKERGDSLKLKALFFLIAHMDIHQSHDYYWADSLGNKVPFKELDYPYFETSVAAFEQVKQGHPGIRPVPVILKDEETITADFLVANVERAFEAWKSPYARHLNFKDFCEYILPYRVSVEPLQGWREVYQKKFNWITDSVKGKPVTAALKLLAADLNTWFVTTFGAERRAEPLPRLGALQLLHRKKGPCEDIAALEAFRMRSLGIPATLDFVPYWATSSGAHFINSTLNEQHQEIAFDVIKEFNNQTSKLSREPAKVLRTTFSRQQNIPLSFTAKENIPPGFMQTQNFTDVTPSYWEVKDVIAKVKPIPNQPVLSYACVINHLQWKPVWWGKVVKGTANFKAMSKGAVYLPAYYLNGKIQPAGYPIAVGYQNELVLAPDLNRKRTIVLEEKEGYLLYRPGKKYKLAYWDNGWKLIAEKTITQGQFKLEFEGVPLNALLLLVPEYSQGKERPFIITAKQERVWF